METFTGGENGESNDSLVRRMVLGVSAKVFSSRINMRAALLERFPDLRDSSVIGAGDLEMTRDKHTVFPSSTGGFADWYVGTTRQLATASAVFDAPIVLETQDDGSTLHLLTIDDSQISCLYHVTDIRDEETSEHVRILSQSRSTRDPSGLLSANAPLIHDDVEGAFTAYQVTEIRFLASRPLTRVRVDGIHMPEIGTIQDWVLQCGQAPIGLDLLVKGAIPTTIRFSAVLHTPAGTSIDLLNVQCAVADHINHLPFGGLLAISGLTTLLHQHLPSGCYVTRPALIGTTRLPDGQIVLSESSDRLVIDKPPYASNRTTLFFCDPSDVSFECRFLDQGASC